MDAREEILSRLNKQNKESELPPAWQSRRQYDDLAQQFVDRLTANKGEVYRASSLEEGLARIGRLLTELKARKVVANAEPPFVGVDLPARWPDIDWYIVDQNHGDLRAFCAGADVGLSGADVALAETGSLIINSGPGKSRLATLLPTVHLALVPTSCLTTDIFTWTAARQDPPPANMVIVSGPSKTADIEQTMAVGIHGPKRFIAVLYDD